MTEGIKPMSDGVELELSGGDTVRPVFKTKDGDRLMANRVWVDSETIVFGRGCDDHHIELTFEMQDTDE